MTATAEKTDPTLWDKVKDEVTKGEKGGHAGQWSARKAQLAVAEYKKAGGGYKGKKSADNHLVEWTHEEWGTKSGKTSGETGERYLPKAARETLTDKEYADTTAKKRADTKKGKQFSTQPKPIAAKAADSRLESLPLTELRRRAADKKVAGRSKMDKAALVQALGHHRTGAMIP